MEIEKRTSKGSLRRLFGGNGKTRKRLVSANPSLPEDLEQAKDNTHEISTCRTKTPSLVARLMGLDSLSTSTVNELSSTALHKVQQRFETQMLPSKSAKAKPIPVTYNKPSRNTNNNVNTVKGRPVSLAIQGKAKVTLTSNGNREYMQKQHNEIASNQLSNKGRTTSNLDSKKPTTSSSNRSSRSVTDTQKSSYQKKRCTGIDVLPENAVNSYESRSRKCSITTDGSGNMHEDAVNNKESEDIVSFTFTLPLRRESRSQFYTQINNVDASPARLCMIESKCTLPAQGSSDVSPSTMIHTSFHSDPHGDKLYRMLDYGSSSSYDTQGSSAVLPSTMIHTSFHSDPHGDNLYRMLDYGSSSSYGPELNMNQESEATDENRCGIYSETENDQALDIPFVGKRSLNGEDSTHEASIDQRNSELEDVKDLLSNITELMEQNLLLNQTNRVTKPDVTESYGEEYSEMERKLLFDCVTECLQLRPKRTCAREREVLWTEDVYEQILSLKSMQDVTMMDFEIEAFQEGLEIECDISSSLINELLSDLLLH